VPIITIESSVPLGAERRAKVLRTLVEAVNELLAITPPTQLRLRIADVPAGTTAIGAATSTHAEPWIVAYAHVLAGRTDAQITHFMNEFAVAIADAFGVDAAHVRVLVQAYEKQYWQIGRRSAAAVGR
jgi:phenylpyruvate tautomerase PptA (4-oxalocrotonate tautomerase family)